MKTLSDKASSNMFREDVYKEDDVREFIKWCLDNNINKTNKTLILPLDKFKEEAGDKLNGSDAN